MTEMFQKCDLSKICLFTGIQPFVDLLGQPAEQGLDNLHHDDQNDHRHPHHRGDEPLVTVPHGDIAQTASTYGTGNGGVAQNSYDGNGSA